MHLLKHSLIILHGSGEGDNGSFCSNYTDCRVPRWTDDAAINTRLLCKSFSVVTCVRISRRISSVDMVTATLLSAGRPYAGRFSRVQACALRPWSTFGVHAKIAKPSRFSSRL